MKDDKDVLAFYIYPEPSGARLYEDDLKTEETVISLFDACQILEAAIFAKGWHFLFKTHGLKKLYELDKSSGWFDAGDMTEWLGTFFYQALISGYNPQTGNFGTYDPEMAIFTTEDGIIEEPDSIKFSETI